VRWGDEARIIDDLSLDTKWRHAGARRQGMRGQDEVEMQGGRGVRGRNRDGGRRARIS
jgi:hypothetical protein